MLIKAISICKSDPQADMPLRSFYMEEYDL